MTKDTGGPAFPRPASEAHQHGMHKPQDGMTLRQYAAIKLRVPDSGNDWLDEMIRKSLRDEFAAKAMQAAINAWDVQGGDRAACIASIIAEEAYQMADAMLEARK